MTSAPHFRHLTRARGAVCAGGGVSAGPAHRLLVAFITLWLCVSLSVCADGKVYVDVTTPGVSQFPVAIQDFVGGKEVSDIIVDDLTFTGLFRCIADSARIEPSDQLFSPANWKGLGVDLVVKGRVRSPFTITVSAYDVTEGREILRKEYSASKDLVRPVAHTIANDIYALLTGQQGIFRSRIAYVGDREAKRTLSLMDWDGQRPRGLGITGGILLAPRWASDGNKLLYAAERARSWGIYLYDLSAGKEKNIVTLSGLTMTGNFFPGNREFVFTSSKEGKSDIYVGDTASMTGKKIISSPWIDVSPSVSPDGSQIVFVSDRSGTPQIYLSDRSGNGIRRITFEGSYNTGPSWSPRADRIAFVSRIGGRHQIAVMKPDGSDMTVLTDRGNNEEPSFSPDGRYIAFTSDRDGPKGIYLMRVDGGGQKRITQRGVKATSPSWSPQ